MTPTMIVPSRRAVICGALGAALATPTLSGCGTASASPRSLRLGYFANLTHAPALIGESEGLFRRHLGSTKVESQVFGAGPQAVQAMLAGALDVAYLGPSPAITSWVRTHGQGVRLIAGAAAGGAALVARSNITSVAQLAGATVATPQLGGTQDVALRVLLRDSGLKVGGGTDEVNVIWMANSQTFDQFRQGRLDAAYLPEPWVSRLVVEAGASVLVDERTRWPGGHFATTSVLVSQEYAQRCAEQMRAFMDAHVEAISWLHDHGEDAAATLNSTIRKLSGKKLKPKVIRRSLKELTFTADPLASTLSQVASDTYDVGALNVRPDLAGFLDLTDVNASLRAKDLPSVSDAGLATSRKATL